MNEQAAPRLGCVADDVTGATDLANNLVGAGMRVIQFFKIPSPDQVRRAPADAIVIALKTRSVPPPEAVRQSVEACRALKKAGCQRFFFKYCSTFDSTPTGNIGPVAEAIMSFLGASQTIYCPAFPRAGRTVYQGHLFVSNKLLHESGMQNHPINPMNDANLIRVLTQQTTNPVGAIGYGELRDAETIRQSLDRLHGDGIAHVVIDTCDDIHLQMIADATASMQLTTGGSGIASFLPAAFRRHGILSDSPGEVELPRSNGRSLILSGSCSEATRRQVARASEVFESFPVDASIVVRDIDAEAERVAKRIEESDPSKPLLVYTTSDPGTVRQAQSRLGVAETAEAVERFFESVAERSVRRLGVGTLIVAGGETSGAVIRAIGVDAIKIGPEICTGVPWTQTVGEPSIALALKSGNFGNDNFFLDALEMLA